MVEYDVLPLNRTPMLSRVWPAMVMEAIRLVSLA